MKKAKLSFQDRFLLAFEREDLPFNSYFYFESEVPFDLAKVKATFFQYLELEAQLSITSNYKTGECYFGNFSKEIYEESFQEIHENEESAFLEKPFSYQAGPAVRIASLTKLNKHLLIFSFHHPLFDGHAQMNFLKDFFDIYNGKAFIARGENIVHFRKYFYTAPLRWYFKLLKDWVFPEKKSANKVRISRLFDREPESRKMGYALLDYDRKTIDLSLRKTRLSSTAFFSICAIRALDKIQRERNETENPIVVYIPKSLRAELKNMRAFQNLIGFIWMKFSRKTIEQDNFTAYFRDFYKFRSSPDEIRKVLFVAALITRLSPYQKLRGLLKKKEQKVHDSSILVSSGRTPKEVEFPPIFKEAKFYARGVMHRSPGIGVLVTSNDEKDFICVEFLKDAFFPETISRFCELLDQEISHYKFDS